jgi:hypothetical protein
MRERSIRTNRRHKFFDCLSGQDVNICTSIRTPTGFASRAYRPYVILPSKAELRKLAWAGIPADFRPLAWQLLLVRFFFLSPSCAPPKNKKEWIHKQGCRDTYPYLPHCVL